MRVFLSSTFIDLVEHRNHARDSLERLGQQADRMEVFGARPEEPQQACFQEIEACNAFLGIYAHRYGYIPPGSDISITEAEFHHARDRNKPMFCFVIDVNYPWLPGMIEAEPGRSKLATFKADIGRVLTTEKFTSPEDLALKVATSVGRYLATTWSLVSNLQGLMQDNSNASSQQRAALADALSAAVDIARRTITYIAQKRRSGHADPNQEAQLSQGWQDAGLKLAALPPPAFNLADRYFWKAHYWADPDAWSDEKIERARIGLDELSAESRTVLLGMRSAENAAP